MTELKQLACIYIYDVMLQERRKTNLLLLIIILFISYFSSLQLQIRNTYYLKLIFLLSFFAKQNNTYKKKQPSIYIKMTLTEKHLKLVILEKKQLFIVFITSIIIIIKQN